MPVRFGQGLGRKPMKLGYGGERTSIPIDTDTSELDAGGIDHYWHPDRDGVEQAPEAFARELAAISPDVKIVRPPENVTLYNKTRAWLLWYRCPRVTHHLSPGWLMLRDWRDSKGQPLPLDGRVGSYLYSVSARAFGSAKKYFDHCVEEMKREKASREKTYTDDRRDRQSEFADSLMIKNIGTGNKFARHHDGAILPSRGERNWSAQNRTRSIPSSLAKAEADAAEKRRSLDGQ